MIDNVERRAHPMSEHAESNHALVWPQAPQTLLRSAEIPDSTRAGKSMLTVIVPDLETSRAALRSRQLSLGPSSGGDFAQIAQTTDLDGNQITLAQPGPAQNKVSTSLCLRVARTTSRASVLIRVLQ